MYLLLGNMLKNQMHLALCQSGVSKIARQLAILA